MMYRELLGNLLEIVGIFALVVACYRVDPSLGLLATGVGLIIVGRGIQSK